jgi:hypothetical protein
VTQASPAVVKIPQIPHNQPGAWRSVVARAGFALVVPDARPPGS